jgi:integrase
MARPSKIWFRNEDGWYMTTIQREQHKLARVERNAKGNFTEKAKAAAYRLAEAAFEELKVGLRNQADQKKKRGERLTVLRVCELFLDDSESRKKPETYAFQQYILQTWCDHVPDGFRKRVGELDALDVQVEMVREWLDAHGDWAKSTRSLNASVVKASFNYAVKALKIPYNPVAAHACGVRRSRKRIYTPEEKQKIFAAIKGQNLKNFVFALEQTGARPFSEIAKANSKHVDLAEGTITFEQWKNSEKTDEPRVIYCTPELLDLLRVLVRQRPEGLLFPNAQGEPFTAQNAHCALKKIEKATGIKFILPYAWRHTYISDSLSKGLPTAVVAKLCGTSERTIQKYYSHLEQYREVLRDAAKQAVSGRA